MSLDLSCETVPSCLLMFYFVIFGVVQSFSNHADKARTSKLSANNYYCYQNHYHCCIFYVRYGSFYKSPTTGILYNNDMDDFSTQDTPSRFGFPPSPTNYIKPGKRSISAMAPFILVDKYGRVKMVLGCSGGPRIITAAVSVSLILTASFIVARNQGVCLHEYVGQ